MTQLWGGRFKEDQNSLFKRFNNSLCFDYILFSADIAGSIAYAKGLEKVGVLSSSEAKELISALQDLKNEVTKTPDILAKAIADQNHEDIHSFVEAKLTESCGVLAKKLHTGRSRNDQVSTDLRIYLRGEIDSIIGLLKNTMVVLVEEAEKNIDVIIPGYTHLQKAQPVLWPHFLLSFFEMFQRDCERLNQARERTNILPLGSGALSGNSFGVDREFLAKELGFHGITKNSLDATGDRDFVVDFLNAASLVMIHLSKLSEDLIIYSSSEFSLVEMSDKTSSGSSLMPQKKNPDALELIRGKAGRVFGHQMAIQTTLKALPSSYNKDLQEDKEAIFDTVATLKDCISMMAIVVGNLKINKEKSESSCLDGYMNATEFADYLVGKGISFREAHHLIGEIVLYANEKNKSLNELSMEEMQKFSGVIEKDIYEKLSVNATVSSKTSVGGTAPFRVKVALKEARKTL